VNILHGFYPIYISVCAHQRHVVKQDTLNYGFAIPSMQHAIQH